MIPIVGGCLRRVFHLVLLVAILAGAWIFRAELRSAWQRVRGEAPATRTGATPELADSALARIERMAMDDWSGRAAFTEAELQSVLVYGYPELVPGHLARPDVELDDSRISLSADVPIERVPRVAGLSERLGVLPDTVRIKLTAQIIPFDETRVAAGVDGLSVEGVPVPGRFVPAFLDALGRRPEQGLGPDAVLLPLPSGAASAYVRADSLVFLSRSGRPSGG